MIPHSYRRASELKVTVDGVYIGLFRRNLCWGILMYDPFQEYRDGMPWAKCNEEHVA